MWCRRTGAILRNADTCHLPNLEGSHQLCLVPLLECTPALQHHPHSEQPWPYSAASLCTRPRAHPTPHGAAAGPALVFLYLPQGLSTNVRRCCGFWVTLQPVTRDEHEVRMGWGLGFGWRCEWETRSSLVVSIAMKVFTCRSSRPHLRALRGGTCVLSAHRCSGVSP